MLSTLLPPPIKRAVRRHLLGRLGVSPSWGDSSGVPAALLDRFGGAGPITLVDVGGFDGDFTARMAGRVGVGRGVLVEPMPHKAAALRARFPGPAFTVIEAAASDRDGTSRLEIHRAEATTSTLAMRTDVPELAEVDPVTPERVIQCRAVALDTALADLTPAVGPVDLLKVDVQGAELAVLRGASRLLRTTGAVWVEVSFRPLYVHSCLFADVYAVLAEAGFALTELSPCHRSAAGELLQADGLFVRRH